MSHLHDHVLLDLLIHGPQRLDDLEALARFASAAGQPEVLRELWRLSHAIQHGDLDATITKAHALAIRHCSIARADTLAELAHEGYAVFHQLRTDPGGTTVTITDQGRKAILSPCPTT